MAAWKRSSVLILLACLIAMIVLIAYSGALARAQERTDRPAESGNSTGPKGPHPLPGTPETRIIVKFKSSTDEAEKAKVKREENAEQVREFDLIQAELLHVKGRSGRAAAKAIAKRPEVEYASPNYRYYPADYGAEPRFSEQWGLHNTGQTIDHEPFDAVPGVSGTPDVDVDALEASAVTRGDPNLVVAVLDDGVDFTHPDLVDRAWVNQGEIPDNGQDDDLNGCFDDVNGCNFPYANGVVSGPGDAYHGTHVAGIIAASANGSGVVGVAPNVKIMASKFIGEGGAYSEDAVAAIEYAVQNGADIINASFAGTEAFGDDPLKNAIESSGMLFVAAAGNGGGDQVGDDNDLRDANTAYPASFDSPNIISVAAATNRGQLSTQSNYGAASVDMSAPGEHVLSSLPGGMWDYRSGTSMAAPHVTGAAALWASSSSVLLQDPLALKKVLMDGVKPLPATEGKTVTGGMVNAKPDTTAPTVTGVYPANGTQQVVAYADVEANFSEPMRASTLDSNTFTVVKQGSTTPVAAKVVYDAASNKAVLTPTAGLAASSTYTATVQGGEGGVKDLLGNPLDANKVWSFTTAPADTTAPETTLTSGPEGYVAQNSTSFSFSSSEPRSSFLCRLIPPDPTNTNPDATPFEPCTSPRGYVGLREGLHGFDVKAVDYAGNADTTPVSRSFVIDTQAPTAAPPSHNFVVPSSVSTSTAAFTTPSVPVRISWSGQDVHSYHNAGITRWELQRSIGGSAWSGDLLQQQPVSPAAGGPESSVVFSHNLDKSYKYRVRGQDLAGNWSAWAEGPTFTTRGRNEANASVTYPAGTWTTSALNDSFYFGGYSKHAAASGARARFTFTGRGVAWVTNKSTNRGRAEVWIDGVKVTTVDLYATSGQAQQIPFQRSWASPGTHTLEVRVLGTKSAASTSTRVDVDAFLTLE